MQHRTPLEAWDFLQANRDAVFVDVRMEIEYLYVGHPPGVVHVASTSTSSGAASTAGGVMGCPGEQL